MDTQDQMFYIAVLVYEAVADHPGHSPLFQECFVLIKASSIDQAREKATKYGQWQQVSYTNERRQTITWTLRQVVDVNAVLDQHLTDGSEIYARLFRNYEAYASFRPLVSIDLEE